LRPRACPGVRLAGHAVARLGDAEVDDLRHALGAHQDVVGADVAVHDVEQLPVLVLELVGLVQARARVGQDTQQHARRNGHPGLGARTAELRERVAVDVLHDEVEHVVLLAQVDDARDVEVLDPGRDARFVEEHLPEAVVGRVLRQDRLDGHELLEAVLSTLARDPDAGHAAFGQGAEQLVTVEAVPRRQRRSVVARHPTSLSPRPRQGLRGARSGTGKMRHMGKRG